MKTKFQITDKMEFSLGTEHFWSDSIPLESDYDWPLHRNTAFCMLYHHYPKSCFFFGYKKWMEDAQLKILSAQVVCTV